MRIVLQRVSRGEVRVGGNTVASVGRGLVLLVGFTNDDSQSMFPRIVDKIVDLRIFEDADGKMNLSLRDIGGGIIAVPQFTLYGNTKKGRRPSFAHAAPPQRAERLFDLFVSALKGTGIRVESGIFGAHMEVELVNDGPVTFIFDLASPGESG